MLLVQCGNGHQAFTENHADPDAALQCPPASGCCDVVHHHGEAANLTGTPCRPVTIITVPGTITMQPAQPGSR